MDSGDHALSFGAAATLYDAVRPSYPLDAVVWALAPLGPGRWRIADIGAGTGIMTRLLATAGHDVVAVEPDPLMRARLVEATPGLTAVAGSAEELPIDDAGLDGAIAAQAYHWFDHARAHDELARVIRPGGVFAAIWNQRDESVPWVAELSRIVAPAKPAASGHVGTAGASDHSGDGGPGGERHQYSVETYGPAFGEVEHARFRHHTRHTPDSLVRLMQSRSYYLRASAAQQRAVVGAIVDLIENHPDLAGRPGIDLPYETLVFRAVRLGGEH